MTKSSIVLNKLTILPKTDFLKKTLKTIAGIIYFLAEKSWRMIICPSRFQKTIAVEAPDGTGKRPLLII